MILDRLENWMRYAPLHPGFGTAFNFLNKNSLDTFKEGKNELDGDRVYAMATAAQGKGRHAARLESHQRYIDIQYTVEGCDVIGYEYKCACTADEKGYHREADIEFYTNSPSVWLPVPAGSFAVFFPEDAHAPMATDTFIHKVVVKVAAE